MSGIKARVKSEIQLAVERVLGSDIVTLDLMGETRIELSTADAAHLAMLLTNRSIEPLPPGLRVISLTSAEFAKLEKGALRQRQKLRGSPKP